jgi:phosphatidylglycerol:prolipoprotein diacylglycerol transferase
LRPYLQAILEERLGSWAALLVPSYVSLLVLGCLLAAVVIVEETRRQGFTPRDTLLVLMIGYAGGLAGAGAVPLIQAAGGYLVEGGPFRFKSGFAAYGGLVGGVAAGAWWLRRQKQPVLLFLDAAAPGLPLAYFFARLGCLMAGCDYGLPTDWAGALRYPPGSYAYLDHLHQGLISPGAPQSLAVYPTQLMMSFSGLLLFFVVRAMPVSRDGRRFFVFVAGYAVLRSLIETFRGDAGRGFIGPLSTSQFIAVMSILALLALRLGRRKLNVQNSNV